MLAPWAHCRTQREPKGPWSPQISEILADFFKYHVFTIFRVPPNGAPAIAPALTALDHDQESSVCWPLAPLISLKIPECWSNVVPLSLGQENLLPVPSLNVSDVQGCKFTVCRDIDE